MVKINLVLVSLFALITIGLSQPKPGAGRAAPDDKFCDKSLSTDKITKMSNCEQFIPQQVKTNVNDCLKKLNQGTTFQEFRNTVCDDSLGPQFMHCQRDILKTQRKGANKPPAADHEAFRKHGDCMKAVLDS